MKKGEKVIWGMVALITVCALYAGYVVYNAPARLMPTYQVESKVAGRGEVVYRENNCSACHRVWDMGGHRGGALDGVGSRRDAEWLTAYLSTENPQEILPSTVKKIYQMPSFASMDADSRADLVAYLNSLKHRDLDSEGRPVQ